MIYDPRNWYWLASDGRLFASARQATLTASDTAYQAWIAAGNVSTPWPKDETGAQTTAALQWVFDNAGVQIFVDLKAYAAASRYTKETGGITVGNAPIATDRGSQAMIANTLAYMTQQSVASVNYKTGAGFVSLSLAQITAIAKAVGAHVQACFDAEQAVDAGISATPPTITTTSQIDAAFAAVTA